MPGSDGGHPRCTSKDRQTRLRLLQHLLSLKRKPSDYFLFPLVLEAIGSAIPLFGSYKVPKCHKSVDGFVFSLFCYFYFASKDIA